MFEIRFQGLITHAYVKDSGNNYNQRAVLYTVPHPNMEHRALLSVSYTDWDAASDPDDFGNTSPNTPRCYDLKGKSSTDLPAGIPRSSLGELKPQPPPLPPVRPLVPSLRDKNIVTGAVFNAHSNVANGIATTDYSIFDVPYGTLFVRNWFPDMAVFNGTIYAMPRTVVFSAKPPSTASNVKFTISGSGKTVSVKTDAIVYITNFPKDSDHVNPMPPHWDAMSTFFDQTSPVSVSNMSIIKLPPFPLGAPDDLYDTCTEPQELSVECSNSQFP
jgi:hypothetical protein